MSKKNQNRQLRVLAADSLRTVQGGSLNFPKITFTTLSLNYTKIER